MLKTSGSTESITRLGKRGVGVGSDGRVEHDGVDDGGSRSGNFDVTFQVIRWHSGHCSFARKSQ